uniref:(California timema) hypothetical protein n=1 Tax=Timema californicum TaxID=61474 RepID=A0A7R9P2Y9_TIMCA|nr:unnamed protein product [Timema californicum]
MLGGSPTAVERFMWDQLRLILCVLPLPSTVPLTLMQQRPSKNDTRRIEVTTGVCVVLRRVDNWAKKLGVELWHCGGYVTRRDEILECTRNCIERGRVEKHFFKPPSVHLTEFLISILPIIGTLVYSESSTLDHTATETAWVCQEKHGSKVNAAGGKTRMDRVSNEGVLKECGLKGTPTGQRERRFLRWFAYFKRMSGDRSYKEATVDERNAATLVQDIAREIKNMTDLKISAVRDPLLRTVYFQDPLLRASSLSRERGPTLSNLSLSQRIMDAAENTAMSHQEEEVTKYEYYNVKRIKNPGEPLKEKEMEMLLTPNKHFNNIPVNTSYSAVHVPTNVYDEDCLLVCGSDCVVRGRDLPV